MAATQRKGGVIKICVYFIGSNNATHKLEKDKACAVASKFFEGFNAFECIGFWHGNEEKSLRIEVVTDEPNVVLVRVGKELKAALKQESIILKIEEKADVAFL